ncbi:MAG: DUF4276 family protein [Gammaproteobacteria bacterium]
MRTATHFEILVEEPSMEAFLRMFLPRLLRDRSTFAIYPSTCKAELLRTIPQRLRGYVRWLPSEWRIVIVVDRDDDHCAELKQTLETAISEAGLRSCTSSRVDRTWQVVSRLAIEELEAWYFGDWAAVRRCFPRVAPSVSAHARYRDPDSISGGTWEAFERLLQRAGYHKTGLRKVEVARLLGEACDPAVNRSRSFCAFRDAILGAASA